MKGMIYGDLHLSSKNRGSHRSYPDESLYYFNRVTELAKKLNSEVIIGLGDLTYGDFRNLKYRSIFENMLDEQNELTKGERYEVLGNHDVVATGYSEYDFYVQRGKLKKAKRLEGSHAVIDVVHWGELAAYKTGEKMIDQNPKKKHIVLIHDFVCFDNNKINDYGKGEYIEDIEGFRGANYIIGGHIHDMIQDKGNTCDGGECVLFYPGSMTRGVNKGDIMQKAGIVQFDLNAEACIKFAQIKLLEVEVSFDLSRLGEKKVSKLKEEDLKKISAEIKDTVRNIVPTGVFKSASELIEANTLVEPKIREKALGYFKRVGRMTDEGVTGVEYKK